MNEKTLFVFDFDGVLVESHREIAIAAYNGVTGSSCTSLQQLPPGYFELFSANRPVPRNASEMMLLARWCAEHSGKNPPDVKITLSYIDRHSNETAQLAPLLFSARETLHAQHSDAWLALHTPHSPLWETARDMLSTPERRILTNKNAQAVQIIAAHFGWSVTSEEVLSCAHGSSKSNYLKDLLASYPSNAVIFIDDAPINLAEIAAQLTDQRLSLFCAYWDSACAAEPDTPEMQALCQYKIPLIDINAACELITRRSDVIGHRSAP